MKPDETRDKSDGTFLIGMLFYMCAAVVTAAWLATAKYSLLSSALLGLAWPLVVISFYGE